MRQIGFDPEIRPADVDEAYLPGETPTEHVERLARAKAEALRARLTQEGDGPEVMVVGGDTVVVAAGRVLTKPVDEADAVRMLQGLSGGSHEVLSGIAIASAGGTVSTVARTRVHMRDYGLETAVAYVATGEPMDKPGGYGIQGLGAALVARIDGDYYSVVGFPVGAFLDLLERTGWRAAFGVLVPLDDG
jgi:septum formation protein